MVVPIHQKLCGITPHLTNVDNYVPVTISVDILDTVNRVAIQSCLHGKYTYTFETKI
jgi:hypothetical protein